VCLPLMLVFPGTINSRSSLLAPAHSGSRKKGRKTVVVWWWFGVILGQPVPLHFLPPFVPEENFWGYVVTGIHGPNVLPVTQTAV